MYRLYAGIVLVALASWSVVAYCAVQEYRSLKPPAWACTLKEFRSFLPEPRDVVVIEQGGKRFFVVYGRQSVELLSDAPSAYLFDSTGALVDWQVAARSSGNLASYWSAANLAISLNKRTTYENCQMLVEETDLAADTSATN